MMMVRVGQDGREKPRKAFLAGVLREAEPARVDHGPGDGERPSSPRARGRDYGAKAPAQLHPVQGDDEPSKEGIGFAGEGRHDGCRVEAVVADKSVHPLDTVANGGGAPDAPSMFVSAS
jgi:hypothetical protein